MLNVSEATPVMHEWQVLSDTAIGDDLRWRQMSFQGHLAFDDVFGGRRTFKFCEKVASFD